MNTNQKSLNVEHRNNTNKFRKMKTKSKNKKSLTKVKDILKLDRNKTLKKQIEAVNKIEDVFTPESYFEPLYQVSAFYEALTRSYEIDEYKINEIFERYKIQATPRYKTALTTEDEYFGMAIPVIDKNGEVQDIVEIANQPSSGAIIRENEVVFVNDNPKSDEPYLSIWDDKVYYSGEDHIEGYIPHTTPYLIGEHLLNNSNNSDRQKSVTIVPSIFLAILLSCIDDDNIYLGWTPYSFRGLGYEEDYYPTHHNVLYSDKMKSSLKGRDVELLTCIDTKGSAYKYIYDIIKVGTPIKDVLRIVYEKTIKLRY